MTREKLTEIIREVLAEMQEAKDVHKAMTPGILSRDSSLKGEDGKIKISKVRKKLSSMKDKGSTKAKAVRRFINYHD